MQALTQRQRDILAVIVGFRQVRGYLPTIVELSMALMPLNRWNNGIVGHFRRLEKKGYITWPEGARHSARAYQVYYPRSKDAKSQESEAGVSARD